MKLPIHHSIEVSNDGKRCGKCEFRRVNCREKSSDGLGPKHSWCAKFERRQEDGANGNPKRLAICIESTDGYAEDQGTLSL